nr:glycine cleavage system aminomethyltransferase GcvT [Haloferula luteola]
MLCSPLEDLHLELGGRLVPFAGWNMPVMYSSILTEHQAVRSAVGVFDISHMGQFVVTGADAGSWLNGLLANDLGKLSDGTGQYTFLLNEQGGVIDDLIVYRESPERYFLVVNASKVAEDASWMTSHLQGEVEFSDESSQWAGMAIQGPEASAAFASAFPGEELPSRNGLARLADGSIVCRTGYTGEDGFELFCASESACAIFQRFMEAGATPCGLGARDSLRLEMGYPLNGSDLSPERTPLEAGLGFFVALDKGDFVGRDAMVAQKKEGLDQRLVGIEYLEKGAPPRSHYPVTDADGEVLGELASGVLSPSLGKGIGMAYLPIAFTKPGTEVWIDVRGRRFPAQVVKKPFYKPTTIPA